MSDDTILEASDAALKGVEYGQSLEAMRKDLEALSCGDFELDQETIQAIAIATVLIYRWSSVCKLLGPLSLGQQ